MPPPDHLEYNPNIIGFVSDIGPVTISLHAARKRYGELPSEYKLVPEKDGRRKKKGLNLALGKLVTETLKKKENILKKVSSTFIIRGTGTIEKNLISTSVRLRI